MHIHVILRFICCVLNLKHCILFLVLKLKLNFSWGEKLKLYELIGGEYQAFTSLLQSFGIIHKVSCPHTHEQNGVVEQKHRHIIESGLTLLAQASLPLKYWDEAYHTAVFLINRIVFSSTPFLIS